MYTTQAFETSKENLKQGCKLTYMIKLLQRLLVL